MFRKYKYVWEEDIIKKTKIIENTQLLRPSLNLDISFYPAGKVAVESFPWVLSRLVFLINNARKAEVTEQESDFC